MSIESMPFPDSDNELSTEYKINLANQFTALYDKLIAALIDNNWDLVQSVKMEINKLSTVQNEKDN